MSVSDFTQVHTVAVAWAKVTKKMYKKYKQGFIGLSERLNKGEIIQVGNLGLKYRVIKLTQYTEREGFIHRIKRVDDASITLTDLNAIKVGGKVRITNRRSFDQKINYASSLREGFSEDVDCGCEEKEYPKLCADKPIVPNIKPIIWQNTACVFGFVDTLDWVINSSEAGEVPHTITSLIINGTEYITPSTEFTYNFDPYNFVPSNNQYGVTYTNQVDAMNQLFSDLGLSNLIQVQVVTDDVWANLEIGPPTRTHGGYYLILENSVTSVSFTIEDNSGFTKIHTWDNGVTSVDINPGGFPDQIISPMYEWSTCTNIDEEPFTITDGVVQEPSFPLLRYYKLDFELPLDGDPGIVIDYIDSNGNPQQVFIDPCPTKTCDKFVLYVCAEYGSITVSDVVGSPVYAGNETCPTGVVCEQDSRITYLGGCP